MINQSPHRTAPNSDLAWRVIENSVDGLLVIDSNGVVQFANPAAVAFFAWRTANLVGFQLGAPAISAAVELILPGVDGLRYVEMRSTEIEWEGSTASLASLRDITESKRAGTQLQRLLEAAPDAIVVTNRAGAILLVNTQTEKTFGYSRDELLGKHFTKFLPETDRPAYISLRETYFADPQSRTVERIGVRKNGQLFPMEVGLSPLETEQGTLMFSAIRDVTERKNAEERSRQLEVMAAEAQAANKAKSMFLSTMSHEIRTPMNAILGYSQLLLRDAGLRADAKEKLKIINRSGEHLLNMIDDILDMAKIEAGRMHLTPKLFDIRGLLRDLDTMFRLRAESNGLQFEVTVSGEPIDYVLADEGKIRQVMINLLGNAVKFTRSGGITLRVQLNYREDQLWLTAQVQDTGVGMTAEEQSQIFQPFVQGQTGQRVRHGGTGLGLAISRGVAQLLGGSIGVSSTPGVGSLFRLEVPVERGDGRAFRPQPGRVIGVLSGTEPPRILIADDVADNREWLSALLATVGFAVRTAENGEAAIRVWEEWAPDLILMDVHMPVMDGLQATRQIKSDPRGKGTVVIALTADVMDDRRRLILASDADDFLSKPCPESELLEKLRTHLRLVYIYDDDEAAAGRPSEGNPPGTEPDLDRLRKLPPDLIKELKSATRSGNKARLDELIAAVAETADTQCARHLQHLADGYEYDNLVHLLEKACHP
jgi:PAS domain S-box-containing protein